MAIRDGLSNSGVDLVLPKPITLNWPSSGRQGTKRSAMQQLEGIGYGTTPEQDYGTIEQKRFLLDQENKLIAQAGKGLYEYNDMSYWLDTPTGKKWTEDWEALRLNQSWMMKTSKGIGTQRQMAESHQVTDQLVIDPKTYKPVLRDNKPITYQEVYDETEAKGGITAGGQYFLPKLPSLYDKRGIETEIDRLIDRPAQVNERMQNIFLNNQKLSPEGNIPNTMIGMMKFETISGQTNLEGRKEVISDVLNVDIDNLGVDKNNHVYFKGGDIDLNKTRFTQDMIMNLANEFFHEKMAGGESGEGGFKTSDKEFQKYVADYAIDQINSKAIEEDTQVDYNFKAFDDPNAGFDTEQKALKMTYGEFASNPYLVEANARLMDGVPIYSMRYMEGDKQGELSNDPEESGYVNPIGWKIPMNVLHDNPILDRTAYGMSIKGRSWKAEDVKPRNFGSYMIDLLTGNAMLTDKSDGIVYSAGDLYSLPQLVPTETGSSAISLGERDGKQQLALQSYQEVEVYFNADTDRAFQSMKYLTSKTAKTSSEDVTAANKIALKLLYKKNSNNIKDNQRKIQRFTKDLKGFSYQETDVLYDFFKKLADDPESEYIFTDKKNKAELLHNLTVLERDYYAKRQKELEGSSESFLDGFNVYKDIKDKYFPSPQFFGEHNIAYVKQKPISLKKFLKSDEAELQGFYKVENPDPDIAYNLKANPKDGNIYRKKMLMPISRGLSSLIGDPNQNLGNETQGVQDVLREYDREGAVNTIKEDPYK